MVQKWGEGVVVYRDHRLGRGGLTNYHEFHPLYLPLTLPSDDWRPLEATECVAYAETQPYPHTGKQDEESECQPTVKRRNSVDFLPPYCKQDEESECQPRVKKWNSYEYIPPYLSEDAGTEQNPGLRLVLVGKTGVGKSASGNMILGRKIFKSKMSFSSQTKSCEKQHGTVAGRSVHVVDTPGLFDNQQNEQDVRQEIGRSINYSSPGPHAFLLVVKLDRFTEEDRRTVQHIQELFGEGASRYVIVLFTRGSELSDDIEDCIKEADSGLRSMLSECGNRYHVFENNNLDDRRQVTDLLDKIEAMVKENGGGCYTNEMFREVERLLQEKEKELRRQYEEKLRQKEEELKARFEKDMEELKTDLEKKMEKLVDEGKERDLKIRTLEEKHKREVAEFERFYQEKGRAARDEAETLDFTHNFIFKMWNYVCEAMTRT